MLLYRLQHHYKCLRWRERAQRTPLKSLYEQKPVDARHRVDAQDFLVVDCEMSGLDARKNELLSLGWVRIVGGKIQYASRKHVLIHSRESVGESIKIHGIANQRLAGAASASKALSLLALAAEHAVLVFHHAVLDLAFLQRYAKQDFACPLLFPYVDTMLIEKRRLDRQNQHASLQLARCRERYGLPSAFQHNAMFDAIATAELFLAQCAYLGRGRSPTLAQLGVCV